VSSTQQKMNPHTKGIQHHLRRWVPRDGQIHCSTEFAFDPGSFICNPLKILTHLLDQAFGGPGGGTEWWRLIWMVDKHGDVVGLVVKRAMGIQRRPPCVQASLRVTACRLGSLERLGGAFKLPSTSGSGISLDLSHARTSWAKRRSRAYIRSQPCTTASRGCCHRPLRA